MTNTLKSGLAILLAAAAGFPGTVRAEGEYQYTAPPSFSNNIVGGGSAVVVNTGNPDASVRVLHSDAFGAQMLGRGQVAVIGGGQDDYQTVVTMPAPQARSPFATLGGLFGGRIRG